MEQNKTGKYLKYAIGEIVLVVIGILIALSINNWNEERKRNDLQQFYLSSIIEELETNVEIYNSIIPNFHKRMESIEFFFTIVNNENSTKKDLQLAMDSVITFIGITFFRTSVFDELNQSGDFKVFNPQIRKLISEYYNDLDNMVKSIDEDLVELNRLRGDWHSSIDYAYSAGLKDSENITVKGWGSDTESIAFMKSTNFYTERYLMMKRTERDFYDRIEITNKLIDLLRNEID